ncbi:disease resistance protein RGA5-like isoform X3 [Triticum dicoccoides]|nr:disease resistance protein RGA5-like isoform X3 [Triticum dicoccoides]XP_044352400.1 disease resistance protein RGA5-like isoform X3 [Triticum aestivum]
MGDGIVLERILSGSEKPTNLALALLQEITENFSEMRKIGEGGFGVVYKGVLHSRIVAVKRIIMSEHTINDRLFDREVKSLMKIISHRNVVRFLGFCSNTHREAIKEAGSTELVMAQIRERLLCFEYISNGSLDKHITDELRGLKWSIRYEIIKGICHGLHYLHEENNIIHMDLKPSNIMINDDMVPKITDFGLSRLDKHTHTSGARFITQGYCAPEYVNGGKTSKKADMYSLGVIITELVTGCRGDPNNVNVLRRWIHRKKEPSNRPFILDIICILNETEENMNEHIDQIHLYSDDMLGIMPLELRFPFELHKSISSIVELINKTKGYYAFNIDTPSRQYCTQPNKGIVSPQSKFAIQITMQARENTPHGMPYTDVFLVQSTKVNREVKAEDITEHMFIIEPDGLDEVNLTVVVYDPEEPRGDMKIRDDTKKKKNKIVEYAFSEIKPNINATHQEEAVPMGNNSISYKDTRRQFPKQLECLSFHTTPSILGNQHSNMSNRIVDLATGAMGSLRHKLGDLLNKEYNLEISVKIDIESLSEELREMQLALCKVSEVHRDYLDDKVKRWADSVREMSYDIEDVVDGFLVHIGHASDMGLFMGLMHRMFNLFTWGKTHNPIEDAIKDIKKQVQVVADRRERCKVDEVMANVADTITFDPRILAIYKDPKELVGIKEPRNKLIRWLSNKDGDGNVSKPQLKIVSIVGFGGLGKTTLAKAVYDELQSQFQHRAFVSVGRNPNVKKLFEHILDKFGYGSKEAKLNEMQLIDKMRRLLQNDRYFIVIDDIWDSPTWNVIKCAFTKDDCGSIVVTTTRIHNVAHDCCRHSKGYVHEMEPLSPQDSRKLLVSRIFGSKEAHPYVPDDISSDILKKCGGLPLAIISIASLLVHNPRSRWDSVRNSLVSVFDGNHDDLKNMEQVLDLSYTHLSYHLKTCLLDIGKYLEDSEIKKEDLLRQWTAQGFVSKTRLRDAEDVAEDYFYKLINMSMIQPVEIDYNDEVLSCRVHDIMLDLIRSKAAEENFNLVIDGPEVVTGEQRRVRRVSIQYNGEDDGGILAAINGSLSHVRSVLLLRGSLVHSFLVLKFIRVLYIIDWRCERLDLTDIRWLFLLRYLKICVRKDLIIPSKIGELQQLETIEIKGRTFLPSDIVTLPRLSHLSYSNHVLLPDEIGRLKSLHTLRGVDFIQSSVENIKGLGELTNLRELEMAWKFVKGAVNMRVDALCSSIGKLSCSLRSLSIGSKCLQDLWVDGWSSTLTPPRRLHKLDLYRCEFQKIPQWIAQLHELDSLTLSVREAADGVSIVAGLPSLAYLRLYIRSVDKREERVIISGREFRALKHMNLECPYLSLVFQVGALPKLETLLMRCRYHISAEFVPVGIENLPSGTLREIRLVVADCFGGHGDDDNGDYNDKAAVRSQLMRSFWPHHPSANITIEFLSEFRL